MWPALIQDCMIDMRLEYQAFPEGNDAAVCNQNLPNDSVYHRFLYIIQVGSACTLNLDRCLA